MRVFNFFRMLFFASVLAFFTHSCSADPTGVVEDVDDPKILQDKEMQLSDELRDFVKEASSHGMVEVRMAELAKGRSQNDRIKSLAHQVREDHKAANEKLREITDAMEVELPDDMRPRHKKKLERLEEFSDENFDRHYLQMLTESHQEAIKKFENLATAYGKRAEEHTPVERPAKVDKERSQPLGSGDTAGGVVSPDKAGTEVSGMEHSLEQEKKPHYAFKSEANHQVYEWAQNTLPKLRQHLQHSLELQQKLNSSPKGS